MNTVQAIPIPFLLTATSPLCAPSLYRRRRRRIIQGGHKPGKPGILRDFSEHGTLREFSGNSAQSQGKIVTSKVFLVRHSNISVKQLLTR